MISRRSIRIKALQALYSQVLLEDNNVEAAIGIYDKSIGEVLEVNLVYLLYSKEIFAYVGEYARQQKGKYLIAESKKNVNIQLLSSAYYVYLSQSKEFQFQIKKDKTAQYIQSEFVRTMFFEMIEMNAYRDYVNSPNAKTESDFLQVFYKRVLFKNEELKNYLESYFANIEEDSDLVHFALRRCAKSLGERGKLEIALGYYEMKKLEEFAYQLIRTTIVHSVEYMKIIEPKLIGWDADRIPILDLMLVKMAMSEMLYFDSIPLKVTVNEYIDLSKIFCSVKSKDFINGIMDRIMKELLSEGKIIKKGRGLE